MNARIDVILPTYNRREFLPKALGCIRKQTFALWRLIVINDGGDDVGDLVSACEDARIVYFDRPHEGKARQLNFGLKMCEAPYVAYMDDDDELYPQHFERLMAAVDAYSADFVYSDTWFTVLAPDGSILSRRVECSSDAPYDAIRLYNRINHKQILHARELSDRVGGYDERLQILIDYDYIKRLSKAARCPVHVREVTGDHILRTDARTGSYASISGLWQRDPEAAGRSLLAFFEKDPEALAELYRQVPVLKKKYRDARVDCAELEQKLRLRLSARWKRLWKGLCRKRRPEPSVIDAAAVAVEWSLVAAAEMPSELFSVLDENVSEIAAVNRIALGSIDPADRELMCRRLRAALPPLSTGVCVTDGTRFQRPEGDAMRWIVLLLRKPVEKDFAIEFVYAHHGVVREQLQVDFRMSSWGDRVRFMVRDNLRLVYSRVEGGKFCPDDRDVPCVFPLDRPVRVRIESVRGVDSFFVDGKCLMSVACVRPASHDGQVALVFYETGKERPIDVEIHDFKLFRLK